MLVHIKYNEKNVKNDIVATYRNNVRKIRHIFLR